MPPLNAGASQTPGHGRGAPTATALAGVARHKLALHLPADATFRHELENKLHLQPFRGIVTAVARDSSGTNNAYIKRTGQLHADPSPYPVFASKMIPQVGDEVLLEYVAGSPTAMVTQARRGGRPDELDMPYVGGSRRTYDGLRALIRKHRDDHNSAHYRTDGTTVAHVTGENGDHNSSGDKYHNVGTLTESGGKSGGYQRHTRQSGRYENRHHDGSVERIATHAEEVSGDHGLYFNGTMHVNHAAAGNGAKARLKQHGSSAFHEHGDDGLGNHQLKHASGQVMWNHTGTSINIGVSGSTVLTHNGTQIAHWAANRVALTHNGASVWLGAGIAGAVLNAALTHDGLTHSVFANNSAVIQHLGSGAGGQMQVRDSSSGWHQVRENTTGHIEVISTGGEARIKTGGVAGNTHLFDGNQHKWPNGNRINAFDGSRLDVLTGSGGGAIKSNSHSLTVISSQVGGLGFTGGVNGSGAIYTYGTATNANDTTLYMKSQYVQVFDGGHANPGQHRTGHGAYGATVSPYGAPWYNGTGYDNFHLWQVQSLHADGSVEIYGTNTNGTGNVSCWVNLITQIVNG